MKTIITVFKKELKDSLRDRRTLMAMVIVPLVLFPLLIGISTHMMISHAKLERQKVLRIGLVSNGAASGFRELLAARDDVRLVEGISAEHGRVLVRADSLDALVVFDPAFDRVVQDNRAGSVNLFDKSTENTGIARKRVRELLNEYEKMLRADRFRSLSLDPAMVDVVAVSEQNLASTKERLAEEIGGLLPYLIVIFCFTGSMYPAIDLAAGEKERGTLETLLTAPAGRMEILLGKFGVVVLTGILTALISLFGIYIGFRQSPDIPPEVFDAILGMLEPRSIALLFSLLLPLTIFFAAVLLSLSIFAKSFKEAQSTITPLTILVIVPAFLGLMPGMTLNAKTALVPILNVSLATKLIIADAVPAALLAEVYASLIVLAVAGMLVCRWIFGREGTIFRGV